MKRIVHLANRSGFGVGEAEQLAQHLSNGNTFKPVATSEVCKLLGLLGVPMPLSDKHPYYVYYNYHPSSGYTTTLSLNKDGLPEFKVIRPRGVVFCAFMPEIIIFSVVDR